MVEIKSLTVESKDFVLKNVSFSVKEGTTLVILGPTGCGKTTLLEAILGLRRVSQGKILVDGRDVTHLPPHKRGFAYVPQDLALFPHLDVEENITFSLRHSQSKNKEEFLELAESLINQLGIEHLRKKWVQTLSGGEKQRVALARALASGSRCLLLDEPFSALHQALKRELWLLFKELQRDYRLTALLVSHDLEEALFLGDCLCVMTKGEVHQVGPKDEVYRYPATLEVAKYFGIKNLFSGSIVGVDGDYYLVDLQELKGPLYIHKNQLTKYEVWDKVLVGIRTEEVMILREDLPLKGKNLLQGKVVSIYSMGGSTLVIVKTQLGERLLEVILPEYAFKKLNLSLNKMVTLSLPEERLFILKGP